MWWSEEGQNMQSVVERQRGKLGNGGETAGGGCDGLKDD